MCLPLAWFGVMRFFLPVYSLVNGSSTSPVEVPAMASHFQIRVPIHIPPSPRDSRPSCPICALPVTLETANTDENGRAIHEDCYVLKLALRRATAPRSRLPDPP